MAAGQSASAVPSQRKPWWRVSTTASQQGVAAPCHAVPCRAVPRRAMPFRCGPAWQQGWPASSPSLLLLLHIKRIPPMDRQDAFIMKKLQKMQCVCCQVSGASSVVLLLRFIYLRWTDRPATPKQNSSCGSNRFSQSCCFGVKEEALFQREAKNFLFCDSWWSTQHLIKYLWIFTPNLTGMKQDSPR